MTKDVIFNYNVDNMSSFKCALEMMCFDVFIGSSGQNLAESDVLVLPEESGDVSLQILQNFAKIVIG